MTKRTLAVAGFLVVVFALVFSGCTKDGPPLPPYPDWKIINIGRQWVVLDMSFKDRDTGYILADFVSNDTTVGFRRGLLKTTDGGETWQGDTTLTPLSISTGIFAEGNKVYVSGFGDILRNNNVKPGYSSYVSTDAGHSWSHIDTVFKFNSRSFCAVNDSENVAVFPVIGKSFHGRDSLQPVYTGLPQSFSFVQFPDSQTGYAAGGSAGNGASVSSFAKSTDGGNHWQPVTTSFGNVLSIHFLDANIGYIVSEEEQGSRLMITNRDEKLYKTVNGGQSWQLVSQNILSDYGTIVPGLHFTSATSGYMATSYTIYITNDGGRTWQKSFASPLIGGSSSISGLYFLPQNAGAFAYGGFGILIKKVK